MKMQKKLDTDWSNNLAYTIGFIATDGNLSSDERHVVLVSKDEELLVAIKESLNITSKVGKKSRGYSQEKIYSVLQVGDKNFYNFLLSIGLTQRKSKTIGKLSIPKKYFSHFLRGCIDGDGSITTSSHPESKHPQLKIRLCSASIDFLNWVQTEINMSLKITGGWIYSPIDKSIHTLSYGKADSIKILHFIYNDRDGLYLERKFKVAKEYMGK